MEVTANKTEKITDMKFRMSDIYLSVSWREVARTYFDKSVPWFQHKMYGIDGNGGEAWFHSRRSKPIKDCTHRFEQPHSTGSRQYTSPGFNYIADLNKSRHWACGAHSASRSSEGLFMSIRLSLL